MKLRHVKKPPLVTTGDHSGVRRNAGGQAVFTVNLVRTLLKRLSEERLSRGGIKGVSWLCGRMPSC